MKESNIALATFARSIGEALLRFADDCGDAMPASGAPPTAEVDVPVGRVSDSSRSWICLVWLPRRG
jgi:hypothetical protein